MGSTIPVDETGNKYGRLTVLRPASKQKPGGFRWVCQCDCGKLTEHKGVRLRAGNVKSCGCLKRETNLKFRRTHFNNNPLDKVDDDIL